MKSLLTITAIPRRWLEWPGEKTDMENKQKIISGGPGDKQKTKAHNP